MEKLDPHEQQRNMRMFTWWVLLAQVFGLTSVILVAVWMGHFQGGFAWQSDPGKEFNYHPLFMIIGMVFLYGDAILVYRVFRNHRKMHIKLLHALLHIFALIFMSVGLKAVFDSHNLAKPKAINNMYSLHSWMGIVTVAMFSVQWLCGLISFLFPGLSTNIRATYKPVHVFWGIVIFCMSVATALMGITEKAYFSVEGYSDFAAEGYLVNSLGLVLVALGITVGYILTNPNFARQPAPDEEHLQLME